MSLPQLFTMTSLADSVSQEKDQCSVEDLRFWSRRLVEVGTEKINFLVTNGQYIWEGIVTNEMKPEPVTMYDETYIEFIHKILDSVDHEDHLFEFQLFPPSNQKNIKASSMMVYGKAVTDVCLLSLPLTPVPIAEIPTKFLRIIDDVTRFAREALNAQTKADLRVRDLQSRLQRTSETLDKAIVEKKQFMDELTRNFIHTLNQKKDMIRQLVAADKAGSAAQILGLDDAEMDDNESGEDDPPQVSAQPEVSKPPPKARSTRVVRKRTREGESNKANQPISKGEGESNKVNQPISKAPRTRDRGTSAKGVKSFATAKPSGNSLVEPSSAPEAPHTPKKPVTLNKEVVNGSGGKTKLPSGWEAVESRSRPGTIVYKNKYTGARQAYPPTEPAKPLKSKRKGFESARVATKGSGAGREAVKKEPVSVTKRVRTEPDFGAANSLSSKSVKPVTKAAATESTVVNSVLANEPEKGSAKQNKNISQNNEVDFNEFML